MKKLIFVSTGRCATTRLCELLKEKLPKEKYSVVHQMSFSRLANVIGNLFYCFWDFPSIRNFIFKIIIKKYDTKDYFISTDPLTSMLIPDDFVKSNDVFIVHIVREPNSFAKSMFNFSKQNWKSCIAHNLVPFWQPYLWPLENLSSKSILSKYEKISLKKNNYFKKKYHINSHYQKISMDEIFTTNFLENLFQENFSCKLIINEHEYSIRSNTSSME